MKEKHFALGASGLLALTAAACSQPTTTTTPTAEEKMGSMETTAPAAQAVGPIRSMGVVTQVDAAAGTITFDHQAIPAINWPAMTMQFHAENSAILQGVAIGDHVSFELKSTSEPQVVIAVHKE